MSRGTISAIYVSSQKHVIPNEVKSVRAIAGLGLEGDRYFESAATPAEKHAVDTEITLIEAEAVEAIEHEQKIVIQPSESRRNLLTRNVALNHLVGREFRVGGVTLRGLRLCEPCAHLEKLTQPGIMKALAHRGGLRAQILVGGEIHVGDAVEVS